MALDSLASSLSGLSLERDGATADTAIPVDDTIDVDAPLAERSDRARVDTINLPPVPCATALASLRERGYRLADAAPDGNCAQRASNRSAGRGPPAAATASDAATLRTLRAQRVRIVDRVTGEGDANSIADGSAITMAALRKRHGLAAGAMTPFRELGHWADAGLAFSFFMWGLADDIALPIVVLQRTRAGTYLDPAVIYRPPLSLVRHCSGDGSRRDKLGLYLHIGYAELLRWLDADEAPRLALVEHVPGHYSPFVRSVT